MHHILHKPPPVRHDIIARSAAMKKVLEQVLHAARTDSTVYIEGKSGTGKELIAKTLHHAGPRRKGPFIAVNCGAIPEALLENELFGHVKGAFTGADDDKQGLLAAAHGGTFFFDEISEMPLTMQVKLLRVLEQREFYPLGGRKKQSFDIRVIAASNKLLAAQVRNGRFREDLYYRIRVIPVLLPPLAERREDIPLLVRHFLESYAAETGRPAKRISPDAMHRLLCHSWPGNIRELKNTIACAVALCDQDVIGEELVRSNLPPDADGILPLKAAKDAFEKRYLSELLGITGGNMSRAAKLAGKYRADLYVLLRKHRLTPSDYRSPDPAQTS